MEWIPGLDKRLTCNPSKKGDPKWPSVNPLRQSSSSKGWICQVAASPTPSSLISLAQKREMVAMLSHSYSKALVCNVLGCPRSSYYYQPHGLEDEELRAAIEQVVLEVSG
jgi:hypothetical protein